MSTNASNACMKLGYVAPTQHPHLITHNRTRLRMISPATQVHMKAWAAIAAHRYEQGAYADHKQRGLRHCLESAVLPAWPRHLAEHEPTLTTRKTLPHVELSSALLAAGTQSSGRCKPDFGFRALQIVPHTTDVARVKET
jgi:hypothetical protein